MLDGLEAQASVGACDYDYFLRRYTYRESRFSKLSLYLARLECIIDKGLRGTQINVS